MPPTVAIYDKALEQIGARLDALKLDIAIRTFDRNGAFLVDGAKLPPEQVDVDYLWLSPMISQEGIQEAAFACALACRRVGVLQTYNAGLDDPFYKRIAAKGTRICNSTAQSVAISEYALAHVLSLVHPIELQRDLQARQQWQRTPFREISQTNWLIIGSGAIGQEVAKRVKAFGAKITVVRRSPKAAAYADKTGTMADLGALLPDADIIVLACALNGETRGFANSRFFSGLKQGAILVNVARGGLIDDGAMKTALDDGRLAAAVLDVFHEEPLPADNYLWSHPKVRMTSHTSFAGSGVRARWDELFLDNIARFAQGQPLANEVDTSTLN